MNNRPKKITFPILTKNKLKRNKTIFPEYPDPMANANMCVLLLFLFVESIEEHKYMVKQSHKCEINVFVKLQFVLQTVKKPSICIMRI